MLAFSPVAVPDDDVQVPIAAALNVPLRKARLFIMSAAPYEAQLLGNLARRGVSAFNQLGQKAAQRRHMPPAGT